MDERGIPYSIGEAKALARSHHDPYVREMLEWLIERAERPHRRYLRFEHKSGPSYTRFVRGPVTLMEVNVKSESFDDLKLIAEVSCSESLTALRELGGSFPIWRTSPFGRNVPESAIEVIKARWMAEWAALEEVERFKSGRPS